MRLTPVIRLRSYSRPNIPIEITPVEVLLLAWDELDDLICSLRQLLFRA